MLNNESYDPGPVTDPWSIPHNPLPPDPALERQLDSYVNRMTVEEKVGQILQVEHTHVTAEDVRRYHFGAILNGGNTVPGGEKYATAHDAIREANAYWHAAVDRTDGRAGIPLVWGTDAVHGHNNMVGSTIFPHNIALGAAANPDLVHAVSRATAMEVLATGLDWTFAPSLAVAMNPRWGRFYESYSSDPHLVSSLGAAAVAGLQGQVGSDQFLSDRHILACAKHFAGDGATLDGIDQGDAQVDEATLATIHAHAYRAAIEAGVQTIMASFSSWNGIKVHGHRFLLTEILKERWGFDGFVVGDWNGHGQIPGASNENGAPAILAGVDMLMAPGPWQALYENTLAQVNCGDIPLWRLNDAVRRILRVKLRAGVFQRAEPARRAVVLQRNIRASEAHLQTARQAVRESLVLMKNADALLPLSRDTKIVVAGDCADDIGRQCGGWTLSWQGDGNTNDDFPHGKSILDAFVETMGSQGDVRRIDDPDEAHNADVAVVVFGEAPYAEFQGDRDHLGYEIDDHPNLTLIQQFRDANIPVVAVFMTGRPCWVHRHINAADAFVVAWLPGTQADGITDVIVGDSFGKPRHDFTGRLPHDWPDYADPGASGKAPAFARGYGLTYTDKTSVKPLHEETGLAIHGSANRPVIVFANGRLRGGFQTRTGEAWETLAVCSQPATAGNLRLTHTSHLRQDDSLQLHANGGDHVLARIGVVVPDLQSASSVTVRLTGKVTDTGASSGLTIGLPGCAAEDVLSLFDPDTSWQAIDIPLEIPRDSDRSGMQLTFTLRKMTLAFSHIAIRVES